MKTIFFHVLIVLVWFSTLCYCFEGSYRIPNVPFYVIFPFFFFFFDWFVLFVFNLLCRDKLLGIHVGALP